ncbi:helix-turn-helix transcriptional regulator [Halomonas litopenaei]|uniref:helix-turn-helix transcriptional regulator n=1 Tax=Halomonas litopenaei TaxID=2109328 RepID=UPI003FA11B93
MPTNRDTLFRYLTLLQLIPRHPGRISTQTLLEKLRERGFQIDARSLQRDLRDRLSLHFPLVCDDETKPYRWYFDPSYHCDLPALNTSSALTLVLAEEYLKGLLPPVVLGQLAPLFRNARLLLNGLTDNGMRQWAQRVRAIPNGKALIPAPLDEEIWQTICQGLLEKSALEVTYLSRSADGEKTFTLHPQGLVSRHSITYLLATVNDYDDIRQFALHRFRSVTVSDTVWHDVGEFDLDAYIQEGGFGYPQSASNVSLKAKVSPQVAWLLKETPLSDTQSLAPSSIGDWHELEAEVLDDQQTLWWLKGLGANVQVLSPQHWKEEILADARSILSKASALDVEKA